MGDVPRMRHASHVAEADLLHLSEIFVSFQGEGVTVGLPFSFIRLAGCPLRCAWCDTTYAYEASFTLAITQVLTHCAGLWPRRVLVTGGEPLAQPASKSLVQCLLQAGFSVWIETSGALDIAGIDERASIVLDVKCPSSGMADRMWWGNLDALRRRDQVKFVIGDRGDFEYAKDVVATHDLARRSTVLMSPVGGTDAALLADWLLDARLEARLSLRLHSAIWGDARSR